MNKYLEDAIPLVIMAIGGAADALEKSGNHEALIVGTVLALAVKLLNSLIPAPPKPLAAPPA